MLEIDGSLGEAGGQILRTALSLSCLLKRPFRIFNIRKNRRRPGLMPQHLMCVHALARMTDAAVRGDLPGSAELVYEPSETKPGTYLFDIGTAGSTTLLLQAVLPPLIFAQKESFITLKGGTHVPFSPPYNFISEVFLPALGRLGIGVRCGIERYGFYPKGGGEIRFGVIPSPIVRGIDLTMRGDKSMVTGVSAVSNLPISIAVRQKNAAIKLLSGSGIKARIDVLEAPSYGKGTFLFLKAVSGECTAGFSSLGAIGKRAETVGEEAAGELAAYASAMSCLDPHLADQILLYLALAEGKSAFKTSRITNHLLTNIKVIEDFLGPVCSLEGEEDGAGTVHIKGKGTRRI